MAYLRIAKYGDYVINKQTGGWKQTTPSNTLNICGKDFTDLKIVKTNFNFKCKVCEKECAKRTRKIRGYYVNVCQNCLPEWCKNSKQVLQQLIIKIDKIEKEVKENKEKWEKEILIEQI